MDLDKFFIIGVEHHDDELPLTTSQFTVGKPTVDEAGRYYIVELTDKSKVTFKIIKDAFMTASVSGDAEDFGRSVGLLGDFYLGKPYGRDGRRVYDFNEYGLEWQVQEDEPMLFTEAREPQLPNEKCRFPEEVRPSRHLKALDNPELFDQAQRACANIEDYDACMDDVMYTGEIALAKSW